MSALFLALAGLAIALLSSSLGIGGGVFTVPVLRFAGDSMNMPASTLGVQAIAGSFLLMVLFAGAASWVNLKAGRVLLREGLILGLSDAGGALIGSRLALQLSTDQLGLVFAALLFASAGIILLRRPKDRVAEPSSSGFDAMPYRILLLVPIGIFTGIVSALTGIGGGFFMVPALMVIFRAQPQVAIATSTFCIVFIALAANAGFLIDSFYAPVRDLPPQPRLGYVYLPLILPLLAGGVLGGVIGARLMGSVKSRHLRLTLALLQVLVGLRMLLESVGQ
ncbi:MAG: sulfite exporter TauE/SafE family protein [Spirochaetales bacterium]|nr:sulfite exporter TauE/SafE family protein [Leptospiraceae bacterium]MCP5482265.1 sulfite exporter TauE/SafE family protein [Spirochaetales bacterium]MCP5484623.1 sulfite exporter TauE/SafE family protein [Spirochaetales bacterium]